MRNGKMKFMVGVLAAGLACQALAAAPQQNATRAPRPAGEERPMPRMMMEDRWVPNDIVLQLERLVRQVEPTAEQQKKIQGILDAKNEVLSAARKAYGEAGKALNDACNQGNESGLRAAAVKVGQTVADLQVIRMKVAAELKAVMTAEQLKKLDEIKAGVRPASQDLRQRIRDRAQQGEAGNRAAPKPSAGTSTEKK